MKLTESNLKDFIKQEIKEHIINEGLLDFFTQKDKKLKEIKKLYGEFKNKKGVYQEVLDNLDFVKGLIRPKHNVDTQGLGEQYKEITELIHFFLSQSLYNIENHARMEFSKYVESLIQEKQTTDTEEYNEKEEKALQVLEDVKTLYYRYNEMLSSVDEYCFTSKTVIRFVQNSDDILKRLQAFYKKTLAL